MLILSFFSPIGAILLWIIGAIEDLLDKPKKV